MGNDTQSTGGEILSAVNTINSTNREITRQKDISENTKMQKERHTEKPKYTKNEIKSTYDTKKQTAKLG